MYYKQPPCSSFPSFSCQCVLAILSSQSSLWPCHCSNSHSSITLTHKFCRRLEIVPCLTLPRQCQMARSEELGTLRTMLVSNGAQRWGWQWIFCATHVSLFLFLAGMKKKTEQIEGWWLHLGSTFLKKLCKTGDLNGYRTALHAVRLSHWQSWNPGRVIRYTECKAEGQIFWQKVSLLITEDTCLSSDFAVWG